MNYFSECEHVRHLPDEASILYEIYPRFERALITLGFLGTRSGSGYALKWAEWEKERLRPDFLPYLAENEFAPTFLDYPPRRLVLHPEGDSRFEMEPPIRTVYRLMHTVRRFRNALVDVRIMGEFDEVRVKALVGDGLTIMAELFKQDRELHQCVENQRTNIYPTLQETMESYRASRFSA